MTIDEPTSEFRTEDHSFQAARDRVGDIQPGDMANMLASNELVDDQRGIL